MNWLEVWLSAGKTTQRVEKLRSSLEFNITLTSLHSTLEAVNHKLWRYSGVFFSNSLTRG